MSLKGVLSGTLFFPIIKSDYFDLQRVAIQQVKELAKFDPEKSLLDALDLTKSNFEIQEQLNELLKKRRDK